MKNYMFLILITIVVTAASASQDYHLLPNAMDYYNGNDLVKKYMFTISSDGEVRTRLSNLLIYPLLYFVISYFGRRIFPNWDEETMVEGTQISHGFFLTSIILVVVLISSSIYLDEKEKELEAYFNYYKPAHLVKVEAKEEYDKIQKKTEIAKQKGFESLEAYNNDIEKKRLLKELKKAKEDLAALNKKANVYRKQKGYVVGNKVAKVENISLDFIERTVTYKITNLLNEKISDWSIEFFVFKDLDLIEDFEFSTIYGYEKRILKPGESKTFKTKIDYLNSDKARKLDKIKKETRYVFGIKEYFKYDKFGEERVELKSAAYGYSSKFTPGNNLEVRNLKHELNKKKEEIRDLNKKLEILEP